MPSRQFNGRRDQASALRWGSHELGRTILKRLPRLCFGFVMLVEVLLKNAMELSG